MRKIIQIQVKSFSSCSRQTSEWENVISVVTGVREADLRISEIVDLLRFSATARRSLHRIAWTIHNVKRSFYSGECSQENGSTGSTWQKAGVTRATLSKTYQAKEESQKAKHAKPFSAMNRNLMLHWALGHRHELNRGKKVQGTGKSLMTLTGGFRPSRYTNQPNWHQQPCHGQRVTEITLLWC